jgi:pyridoxamine 5'-phosphate oxidase
MSNKKGEHGDSTPDIAELRRPASGLTLDREDLDADPIHQFETWLRAACDSEALDPNAMSVSTVGRDMRPSCRMVLLKYYDERGFVFFTNLESNKANQIAENENVALLFFWPTLGRQIGIRGSAERISTTETMKYFMTRPRGSQIGAWVSAQSSVISSRSLLEAKYAEIRQKFADGEVPLPSFWGGYRVTPVAIEFWQSRTNRLHDRFLYSRTPGGWDIERLSP